MEKIKKSLFEILEKDDGDNRLSRRFDLFIMIMIFLNMIAVIMETVDAVYIKYDDFFEWFEIVSVVVFTLEYLGRIWTCTLIDRYNHLVKGRIKFILSPIGLIDLLAILPFYLPFFMNIDGRILRLLRLFRLIRIFKMGRYSTAFKMIANVLNRRKEELLVTLTIVLLVLVLASSLMYYVEHEVQPEAFSSIPATMWWGVATLTTVGYGDVYPITSLGRILGAFIAIMGVGIFALPAGIIASGFEAEIRKKSEKKD